MNMPEPTHTKAWRVGKKKTAETSNFKERALFLRFPDGETRGKFLSKRSALKKTGDDLDTLLVFLRLSAVRPESR